jgi:predicted short-subunit dehydrogenase-like oxidoreductase (DUF2520 family)
MKKRKPLEGITVVFIGAGNAGSHLEVAFRKAGASIPQIVRRTAKGMFTNKFNAEADIYIIAVPDDAIGEVVKSMPDVEGIVAHTSGSVDMNVLKRFKRYGVFYPLQSLSKGRISTINAFPICIEGNSEEVTEELMECAGGISKHAYVLNSEERATVHLAAVFANNFSNHMFAVANEILSKKKLPFDLLKPLILETAFKVAEMEPQKAQTGPALRGDRKTIAKHKKQLTGNKNAAAIYKTVTEGIAATAKKKK